MKPTDYLQRPTFSYKVQLKGRVNSYKLYVNKSKLSDNTKKAINIYLDSILSRANTDVTNNTNWLHYWQQKSPEEFVSAYIQKVFAGQPNEYI